MADAWNFCYVIPDKSAALMDNTQIVVPNSLQMRWTELLPFFYAAAETARDIIAQLLHTNLPQHPFEMKIVPTEPLKSNTLKDLETMVNLIKVFIDDFIRWTNDLSTSHLTKLS